MRGRLLLAHRPGRSLLLPRDRRGERPRTTASPLGAVGTILGPGWGHAIRPITAGRAIGGGDRRRLGRRAHPRRCRNRLGLRIASPRGSTGDVVVSEHDVVETASPAKNARISWRPPAARTKTPLVG